MARPWWRSAAFYQIYVRSFQDSNGDGIGDLQGIRSRLPYLQELGVDALWLTPFYPSPQVDHGYDVADYTDVDPLFGTLADFDELVADAHERGIKVTIDIVPNHTSDQHPWFRNAIADASHPDRKRYMFRPGRNGGPPNGWTSAFGGPAWTLDEKIRRVLPPFLHPRAARSRLAPRSRPGQLRRDPPFLARPRRRRLPDRRRPRALQGAGSARDGRADTAAALRRLALGADAAGTPPALPPLAPDRRRVPRRPHVRQRDHDREPGHDRGYVEGGSSSTCPSTSPPSLAWDADGCARRSTAMLTTLGDAARPRPGSSRTTT